MINEFLLDKDFKVNRSGIKVDKTDKDRKKDLQIKLKLNTVPESLTIPAKSEKKHTKILSKSKSTKIDSLSIDTSKIKNDKSNKTVKSNNQSSVASELYEVTSGSNTSENDKKGSKCNSKKSKDKTFN